MQNFRLPTAQVTFYQMRTLATFLKVYKVSVKKVWRSLMTPKSHSVHLPPPSTPTFCRGVELPTKFSKTGGLAGPQLLEGRGCWERGDDFFKGRGGGGAVFT